MPERSRGRLSPCLGFWLALSGLALVQAACGGGGGSDTETLIIGGTKAREGVAGGGGATAANTLLLGDNSSNAQRVALLSFSLASLPAQATVLSATLQVHHAGVTAGSPYPDLGVLVVDSVDLGTGVDASDATSTALIAAIGTLSEDASVGARNLDVTAAVLADLAAQRTRSEFRLRFTTGTDNDSQQDTIQVSETDSPALTPAPRLVIRYEP